MAVDWSTLPLDLLGLVAIKLKTFEDFINFSAVCRRCNRTSSSIKHQWSASQEVLWLLLAENTKDNNPDCIRKILNLSNNKCYKFTLPETFGAKCFGSTYGWVAMIDRNFDVQLFNPITKAQIHFPSLKPLYDDNENDEDDESYQHWFLRGFADNLVMLKVPQNGHDEFVVLVVYGWYKDLAFARHGDQWWTPVFVKSSHMLDIVGMEDNVFGLCEDGSIVSWNVEEFNTEGT